MWTFCDCWGLPFSSLHLPILENHNNLQILYVCVDFPICFSSIITRKNSFKVLNNRIFYRDKHVLPWQTTWAHQVYVKCYTYQYLYLPQMAPSTVMVPYHLAPVVTSYTISDIFWGNYDIFQGLMLYKVLLVYSNILQLVIALELWIPEFPMWLQKSCAIF